LRRISGIQLALTHARKPIQWRSPAGHCPKRAPNREQSWARRKFQWLARDRLRLEASPLLQPIEQKTGDGQIITGFKLHGFTFLEIQSGVTAKHNHPFVLRLIVPEIWRATVGARHDALDVRRAALKKPKKIFRTNLLRQIGKNIFYLDVHNQPFTRRARLIAGTSMMRRWPRSGGFSAAEIMAVMNCSIVTKPSLSALARVPGNDSAIL